VNFFKKLSLTGDSKRIKQLKELRQIFIVAITVISLAFSIAIPLFILNKMGFIGSSMKHTYDKNIAIVHLNKEITLPYINDLMKTLDNIKKEVKDGSYTQVLIIASSPGGSPQGSDELANYLIEYQKEVPTTFYVQGVCASGCYYIASSIQHYPNNPLSGIIANPNSIVGSIGVVIPHLVYGPALNRLGVENEYIYEGKYKVPIDSWELASSESKAYIKSNILSPVYKTFREFVKQHRNINESSMSKLDEGRVFVATLVNNSLVDRISNLQTIKTEIKEDLKKQFPNETIGFVEISTNQNKSLFVKTINDINVLLKLFSSIDHKNLQMR